MPSTPSGYVLPPEYYAAPGTTIRSTQHNAPLEDLAQGVNDSFARDGSRPATGNLPMNGRKITGLGEGTAAGDAVNFGQVSAATASAAAAAAAASAVNARVTNLISSLTSAMNASCPVGMVAWHNGVAGNIPSGWIAASGDARTRSDFPDLWSWASSSAIADSSWISNVDNRAKYSAGNGSSTFRLPDLNGVQLNSRPGLYLRGSGGGTIQQTQGDAARPHTHGLWKGGGAVQVLGTQSGSVAGIQTSEGYAYNYGGRSIVSEAVDPETSSSTPTAAENRPVSAIGVWIIRATPFSFAGI